MGKQSKQVPVRDQDLTENLARGRRNQKLDLDRAMCHLPSQLLTKQTGRELIRRLEAEVGRVKGHLQPPGELG